MAAKIVRTLIALLLGVVFFLVVYSSTASSDLTPLENVIRQSRTSQDYIIRLLNPSWRSKDKTGSGPESIKKDVTLALLDDPIPRRDFAQYAAAPPHNAKDESGNVYATLLCTREPNVRDPFFAATQSLVYRLLWSPWHGSYPVIVFVCPFIPELQRTILRGQGAIVREIGLLDQIVPADKVPVARWLDQFSKLNMWRETDFKKIAYLDVDAFPMANIDDVFELVPEQDCMQSLLSKGDEIIMREYPEESQSLCKYTFGGVDPYNDGEINGGFLVFSPSESMYQKLIRGAQKIDQYDLNKMEQGLLKSKLAFHPDGAFKATKLPPVYNAVPDYYITHRDGNAESADGSIKVLHDKLWNPLMTSDRPELNQRWDLDWMAMCRFYDGDRFAHARETGRLKEPLEIFFEGLEEQRKNGEID